MVVHIIYDAGTNLAYKFEREVAVLRHKPGLTLREARQEVRQRDFFSRQLFLLFSPIFLGCLTVSHSISPLPLTILPLPFLSLSNTFVILNSDTPIYTTSQVSTPLPHVTYQSRQSKHLTHHLYFPWRPPLLLLRKPLRTPRMSPLIYATISTAIPTTL